MSKTRALSRRVGILYLVAGAESQALTVRLRGAFLPASQWSAVFAQIRRDDGQLIEKTMTLTEETATEAVYVGQLVQADIPLPQIVRIEYELVSAVSGLRTPLPSAGYIEGRVRPQV